MELTELFSLLSDETRLRCLFLLSMEKELCVCEINHLLKSIQPRISRHLSILRQSKLVLCERRGQWVFYTLNTDLEPKIQSILFDILNKFKEFGLFSADSKKLIELKKDLSSDYDKKKMCS